VSNLYQYFESLVYRPVLHIFWRDLLAALRLALCLRLRLCLRDAV